MSQSTLHLSSKERDWAGNDVTLLGGKVSILINNYNYGRFVSACITSALKQTVAADEVIVVDDGSTDNSLAVIAECGPGVRVVAKSNGGQASAYNAGFAASSGDIVCFLDADDVLLPTAVATWKEQNWSGTAKLHCRMETIGADGILRGRSIPTVLNSGDLRAMYRRYGDYGGPPSSGNVYGRSTLKSIFPLPEAEWRYAADSLPFHASVFFGRVVTVDSFAQHRIHSSTSASAGLNTGRKARATTIARWNRERLQILRRLTGEVTPEPCSPNAMTQRFFARVNARSRISGGELWLALTASVRYPGYSLKKRVIFLAFFVAVYLSSLRFPFVNGKANENDTASGQSLPKS